MGKAVYAQVLDDAETDAGLKRDIAALKQRLDAFWERWLGRCYPFDPAGPKVVSLHRGRFGSLLKLMERRGAEVSPDPIDPEVETLIRTQWVDVLAVGIDRVLRGILVPEHRTAAFEQDQDRLDKDAFPRAIVDRGRLGFHYLTGLRGQPVYVETLGAAPAWAERGGPAALDALAADLLALTFFDARQALPLPLWYAQTGVEVIKRGEHGRGLLEFYKAEALRTMREEQVDKAWLSGWEGE
jgi:hypothetical protein